LATYYWAVIDTCPDSPVTGGGESYSAGRGSPWVQVALLFVGRRARLKRWWWSGFRTPGFRSSSESLLQAQWLSLMIFLGLYLVRRHAHFRVFILWYSYGSCSLIRWRARIRAVLSKIAFSEPYTVPIQSVSGPIYHLSGERPFGSFTLI
jgi:hypothetical protein